MGCDEYIRVLQDGPFTIYDVSQRSGPEPSLCPYNGGLIV